MFVRPIPSVVPSGAAVMPPFPRKDSALRRRKRLLGLALTEVLVGIGIITLTSATALWALGAANRLATVNRNFTGAKTLIQNKIDEVLSAPYPVNSVPSVLNAGSTIASVTVNPGPPAITGTMTTNVLLTDPTLNIREVKITVAYPYNGTVYSLSMATARSPD
jgi:type II secretory pathway pseudopilin PulG